jgi:hypothetical protein
MAIVFVFYTLVLRKNEIESRYAGGLAKFRSDWLRKSSRWCEDKRLVAFTSMGDPPGIADFEASGIDFCLAFPDSQPEDVVSRWKWLDYDHYTNEEPDQPALKGKVVRFWLRGESPGTIALWWNGTEGKRALRSDL